VKAGYTIVIVCCILLLSFQWVTYGAFLNVFWLINQVVASSRNRTDVCIARSVCRVTVCTAAVRSSHVGIFIKYCVQLRSDNARRHLAVVILGRLVWTVNPKCAMLQFSIDVQCVIIYRWMHASPLTLCICIYCQGYICYVSIMESKLRGCL